MKFLVHTLWIFADVGVYFSHSPELPFPAFADGIRVVGGDFVDEVRTALVPCKVSVPEYEECVLLEDKAQILFLEIGRESGVHGWRCWGASDVGCLGKGDQAEFGCHCVLKCCCKIALVWCLNSTVDLTS